jgi:hypothetical protein
MKAEKPGKKLLYLSIVLGWKNEKSEGIPDILGGKTNKVGDRISTMNPLLSKHHIYHSSFIF